MLLVPIITIASLCSIIDGPGCLAAVAVGARGTNTTFA